MFEKLCNKLFNLTYYSSHGYALPVISEEHKNLVKETILKVLNEYNDGREAKLNVYEKIISNSNFAPMLEEERMKDLQKIDDRLNKLTDIITSNFNDVMNAIINNENKAD